MSYVCSEPGRDVAGERDGVQLRRARRGHGCDDRYNVYIVEWKGLGKSNTIYSYSYSFPILFNFLCHVLSIHVTGFYGVNFIKKV